MSTSLISGINFRQNLRLMALTSAVLILSGCAVGPDFVAPAAPQVNGYTKAPLPAKTRQTDIPGGNAQSFTPGGEIPAQWWQLFHSKPLNSLINTALKANPNLQAAQASLRQAQETYLASISGMFPSVAGSFDATRQKTPSALYGRPGAGSSIYTLFNAQAQVSYTLDLFGGVRRSIEEQKAAVNYQNFQLQGAYLSLTANVVTATIQLASLRTQIAAAEDVINAQKRIVKIVGEQFKLGAASQTQIAQQQAQLALAEANLPALKNQLAKIKNQLAVLTGSFPSQFTPPNITLDDLTLPADLPVSLPSRLVEQRPDIRAAQAQLHQASAAIGVATANMLPQITITGNIGSLATAPGNLLSPGGGLWSIGGKLLQPIFEAGKLLHQRRAAVAAYEMAAANYRSTVLTAFSNVSDTLHVLVIDADALSIQLNAERAAKTSFDLASKQYKLGSIAYPTLLQASLSYQQTRASLAQARAARYADTAALFQALGGGWWNRSNAADTSGDSSTN